MVERIILSAIIGLIAIAGFEFFNRVKRFRASTASQINKGEKGSSILYFRSDNCSGCAAQNQIIRQLAVDLQKAIKKIDVDENPQLAETYGVISLPTTLVMDAAGNARYINYGVVNPRKLTQQWVSVTS